MIKTFNERFINLHPQITSLSSKEVDLINKVLKKIDDEVPKVKKFVSKKKVTKSKSKKKLNLLLIKLINYINEKIK